MVSGIVTNVTVIVPNDDSNDDCYSIKSLGYHHREKGPPSLAYLHENVLFPADEVKHLSVLGIQILQLIEVAQLDLAVLVVAYLKFLKEPSHVLDLLHLVQKSIFYDSVGRERHKLLLIQVGLVIQHQEARPLPALLVDLAACFGLSCQSLQELRVLFKYLLVADSVQFKLEVSAPDLYSLASSLIHLEEGEVATEP